MNENTKKNISQVVVFLVFVFCLFVVSAVLYQELRLRTWILDRRKGVTEMNFAELSKECEKLKQSIAILGRKLHESERKVIELINANKSLRERIRILEESESVESVLESDESDESNESETHYPHPESSESEYDEFNQVGESLNDLIP